MTIMKSAPLVSMVSQNVVIRNLVEKENEELEDHVNNIFAQELQIEVKVKKLERKVKHNNKSGVVIAKMKSLDDRGLVLSNKSKLKDSDRYRGVMIYRDKPLHERRMETNMSTLINTVAKDKLI
jgi:hypothetical protein